MNLNVALLRELKCIPAQVIGLPTGGADITSVERVTAEQGKGRTGEFYRVCGAIHPVDPAAPEIQFQAGLPVEWNGKLLQQGGGGLDGFVLPAEMPVVGRSMAAPSPLAAGYVVFGSDGGHPMDFSRPWDCSWALHDEALVNFAHAQLKKTRDLVWWLASQCYGEEPQQVYFAGGSNGGRECMKAIQNYPEDYDGAICFYPVLYWVCKVLADQRYGNTLNRLGEAAWMDARTYEQVQACILRHCDALDGAEDGIVSDLTAAVSHQAQIRQDLAQILTPEQLEMLDQFAAPVELPFELGYGPVRLPGYAVYQGAPVVDGASNLLGSSASAREGSVAGADGVIACMIRRDEAQEQTQFDPTQWKEELQTASRLLDAYTTDLDAFAAHGGKLILLQGGTDPLVTPFGTIEYYHRLLERYGAETLKQFLCFYLVPGYGHGSGSGFLMDADLLSALDAWVREDERPAHLVAEDQNDAVHHRTRPLYEYPYYPHYSGEGEVHDAASFSPRRLSE